MVIRAISRFGFHSELDMKEFQDHCISLAKEIDAAIWKNEVPRNVQELALTLNHTCRHRSDVQTRAVVMMLMISVKNACDIGLFPQRDSQELLDIVDSMWNGFSSPENVISSVNSPISLIQQVIERFYPFLKLGHILVSFEAKPESNLLVKDFHISEKIPHSPKQIVGLFVVRTEDVSKSNCIIHPQEVSFLLNGNTIEKRVKISMDSGPQLPTNVTSLLNVGANLLQTIGCFGGSYFIVIAFMDVIPLTEKPLLKDYVHHEVIESNSDCDIMEGPSRISLNCPISRTRIKFPVKGHVCKHLQCFDFWNYVNINMRRPSWRCPHCNQSVCYTDIRVDQNMIKILEGVGCNAADVVISADGSWKVVTETDENLERMLETTHDHVDSKILDLTSDENEMETSVGCSTKVVQKSLSEIQDLSSNTHKPATESTLLNQSSASNNTLPQLPQTLNAFNEQQFVNLPQVVDIIGSGARRDRLATNTSGLHTSMPVSQSYQFRGGSHVASPLGHFLGRTSDLVERWNHVYGSGINQTQWPLIPPAHQHYTIQNQRLSTRSLSYAQQRAFTHPRTLAVNYGGTTDQRQMPSFTTHPQNLAVNYGRTADQRPDGAMGRFSSQELMNSTSTNTVNWRPQTRMRGSIVPGSTVYDHMIIQPTRPVQAQAPPPQPTAYTNDISDEIQAFLAHPSYPTCFNQTQTGTGSLPVGEGVGLPGTFWSMPPETW